MVLGTFQPHPLKSKDKTKAAQSDSETEDDDIVVVESKDKKNKKLVGWAYIGSHNFTPSAWGTLSGSSFNPTLNARTPRISSQTTPD